jgi:hypothetical protein
MNVHVDLSYTLTANDQGEFTATVEGVGPDNLPLFTKLLEAIKVTGGTWQNTAEWDENRRLIVVKGQYSSDPNYGDYPSDILHRIGSVVGPQNVSETVHQIGGADFFSPAFADTHESATEDVEDYAAGSVRFWLTGSRN